MSKIIYIYVVQARRAFLKVLSNSNGSTSNHTDSKPVTKKSIIRRGQEVQLTSSSAPGMCSSSMTEVFETEPLHNNDNQFRQVKLEKDL